MASNYSKPLVKIWTQANSSPVAYHWENLPTPSEYGGKSATLVDSARNSGGVVVANIIRSDVASISMTWNYLTVEQFKKIAQIFEPKYNGQFINFVCFWDAVKGDFNGTGTGIPSADESSSQYHKQMYVGDRDIQVAHICLDTDGKPVGYEGVKLDMVEV